MKSTTPSRRTVLAEIRHRVQARIADFRRNELPTGDLDRLLRDGELFAGAAPLRGDVAVWAWFRRRRARPKRCFEYAQRFVLDDPAGAATYFEGYVIRPDPPPVHHAWLVAGGRVFDPTLESADKTGDRGGDERDRRWYFGLPFDRPAVADSMLRNAASVPLLSL